MRSSNILSSYIAIIATITILNISSVTSSITDEVPYMILPSGAIVYNTPPSGGTIKVIIPSNDDGHGIEDVDGVGSTYIEPLPEEDRLDEDNDVPPELIVEPIEEMMETIVNVEQAEASATTTTTSGSTSSNEAGEEEEDYGNGEGFDVATYAVDISTLSDLTKDLITIELGSTFDGLDDAIEFRREVEYDEAVEQQLLLQDQGSSDNNNNNNMRRRGRRRRRHRRALDIAQDSLCDTLDLSDGCEISIEPGIDYLPPNAYFEPFHASQKFEYFEGSALYKIPDPNSPTSSTITAEASLYVRKMTHPTLENKQYISGTLTTGKYDYEFYGDMETGETIMKIVDPEKTPNMPQPLVPPEEDDDDENEYYESSSYGEIQVDGRRRMEGGDDAVVDEEFESFKDQVNRQVQHHLEKERLKQRRRMQSDDGSVIDVLVAYTRNAVCEKNGHGSACSGKDDEYFLEPTNHQSMIERAQEFVDKTNLAYITSKINFQLRLVHTHFTGSFNDAGYDCGTMIGSFQGSGDGIIDEIQAKRNEWGADVVALLTSGAVSGCGGVAYVGPSNSYMYSVTLQKYGAAVFAHEVGHNFGCQHDRLNGSPNEPWAFGWQDPQGRFRTIMAYSCSWTYCPRRMVFSSSDPEVMYNGLPTGNALNDCARRHNESSGPVATYRTVRLTNAPTKSSVPSISLVPSPDPTAAPTHSPTVSSVPSNVPSLSFEPSETPSEYPTFDIASLDEFSQIDSPGTTSFNLARGIMFNVAAKEVDIRIHNFRIPFAAAGNMIVNVWSTKGSNFWYEKNNQAAWDLKGSPDVFSPGITLEDPMPLAQRGGLYYGFEPIVIPAGTSKGIYLALDSSSIDDNYIGMDRKASSICADDFREPFDFDTWFEDDKLAVSEGIYKNQDWTTSSGTSNDSFRFLGSIYYHTGTHVPSITPSISSAPSMSSLPSISPSMSSKPSEEPTESPIDPPPPDVLLDEAILNDILDSYDTHIQSTCPEEGSDADTTFSFDFVSTDQSNWSEDFAPFEETLFQAQMTHTDNVGRNSWSIRIGTGGNMYSHFTPGRYGETLPPQQNNLGAPFVDEVHQSVSVNDQINLNNNYKQWCPGPSTTNKEQCKPYFIHQAGAYQKDSPYTDVPFYSPSLAKSCSGNSCIFASWGTQAHVKTPFTSPIMYINKYTNCGSGIIEFTQMIHNFAPTDAPALEVDQTYFNVPWSGVRSSTLPYALEPNPSSGDLTYDDPDNENYLKICPWGYDGPNDTTPSGWRGQRKSLSNLGGYTTFVDEDFQLNYPTQQFPAATACRKEDTDCSSNPDTCMVGSCTDAEVVAGERTRIELKVAAGQTPECQYSSTLDNGYIQLKCKMRDSGFGNTGPYKPNVDRCAPWTHTGFKNTVTEEMLDVSYVRHWSRAGNQFVYFAVFETVRDDAIALVNAMFNNTEGSVDLPIEVWSASFFDSSNIPADYNPSSLSAFTFVYGDGAEYGISIDGLSRRRIGSTQQGVGFPNARDYTVFTINWHGSGARLEPGSTYMNRQFVFSSDLGDVKATGEALSQKTVVDEIGPNEWSPRKVDIYTVGTSFVVKAASLSESESPGLSTTCDNSAATKVCSGFSTPSSGYTPYFYVTCGTETYYGSDPYHFTPDFSTLVGETIDTNGAFPGHGFIATPTDSVWTLNGDGIVRSYACEGLDATVRPTWKLLGFFPSSCSPSSSLSYDETICVGSGQRRGLFKAQDDLSNEPSSTSPRHRSLDETLITLSSPSITGATSTVTVVALDSIMFEVEAKNQNVIIQNFELVILSASPEYMNEEVELSVYTTPDSFYDSSLSVGDGVAQEGWTEQGTVQVTAATTLEASVLPTGVSDIYIEKGSTIGIFIAINDPLRNHKILLREGGMFLGEDFSNDDILVRTGLAKQWEHCLGWGGETFRDYTNNSPRSFGLFGSVIYNQAGTSIPTSLPSSQPSFLPSTSVAPSMSLKPSLNPSISASPSTEESNVPSISSAPSINPTKTPAPTNELVSLVTPTETVGDQGPEGSSGDGVMFDIVASKTLEVFSFTFGQLGAYPMNIRVYTRIGSHYYAYDDESQWEMIQSYTNYTYDFEDDEDPRRISFEPQFVAAGSTRAFYIAITETYGETRPLVQGLLAGYNYKDGIWASDDALNLMEGLKVNGISEERPFGNGTDASGVFNLQGPGGLSYNMKDTTIRYREITTIPPTDSPSISSSPSYSTQPSNLPSISARPSLSPSISLEPSIQPSFQPSMSQQPSLQPSTEPSLQPTASSVPSQNPSISLMPSLSPSEEPSFQPSKLPSQSPSVSFQPSDSPSMQPSDSPSISKVPSLSPSLSLMPSFSIYGFDTYSAGNSLTAAYGIMFDVEPNRAMIIETFHLRKRSVSQTFNFQIYTKSGSYTNALQNEASWEKIGEVTLNTNSENTVRIPSTAIDSVTIYAGQRQSFYIASLTNWFYVGEESASDTSDDLTVNVGHRKYPYSTLFGAGSSGFSFQGVVKYSKISDPPSSSPSELPSESPSLSHKPTGASPSLAPSQGPSLTPSVSLVPSVDRFAAAVIKIVIPSLIKISGFEIPTTPVETQTIVTIMSATLMDIASANLNPDQRVKEVKIVAINGVPVDQASLDFRRHRQLEGTGDELDIDYELIMEEICATDACDNAQEVANAFYEAVTTEIQEAVDSGDFAEAVEAEAAELNVILNVAVASSNFSEIVVALLNIIIEDSFYPDWKSQSGSCLNDGKEPKYMKKGGYIEKTLQSCCRRWFSWDFPTCMNVFLDDLDDATKAVYAPDWPSGGSIEGWFPNWSEESSIKCVNDTATLPDYMQRNPSTWLFDDAESCCYRYFGWEEQQCLLNSDETVAEDVGTNKWYVDWVREKCVKDCASDTADECGGLAKRWESTDLYASSSDCCKRIYWIDEDECSLE